MKLLLYCNKGKPLFLTYGDCDNGDYATYFEEYVCDNRYYDYGYEDKVIEHKDFLNGKIVAECDYEISEIEFKQAFYLNGHLYITKRKEPFKYFSYIDLLKESCLQDNEMLKYLGNKNGKAIHIKNLKIFDEPKKLNEYYYKARKLEKAPQNMMMVQELTESARFRGSYLIKDYVLISIRPEWLCKILNGEKTIEVRKKVLKEML